MSHKCSEKCKLSFKYLTVHLIYTIEIYMQLVDIVSEINYDPEFSLLSRGSAYKNSIVSVYELSAIHY